MEEKPFKGERSDRFRFDGYLNLSPSIHKFGNVFIYSGLSAALGHELGPNGVSNYFNSQHEDT